MSAAASTAPQNKSLEWMNRLRANPKIPLIVAGAAAIAILVAMVLWAKSPDYRTLYSNLSDQDGGAIVTQLTQMNIPYRFADNGGALEVPADKVHELRLRLAQQGLPKGGAVGFELLDLSGEVRRLRAGAGRRVAVRMARVDRARGLAVREACPGQGQNQGGDNRSSLHRRSFVRCRAP